MAQEIYRAIVDGILTGGVYALMAVGLTLIFGVLDIINIAQGVLVILGAYLSYELAARFHIDLFVGLLVTVPAMFVIGVVIQWAFIRRLRGRERTSMTLLVTYAVALIIEGILYEIYRTQPQAAERLVRAIQRARVRLLPIGHLPVRLRAGGAAGRGHLPAAVPDYVRAQRAGHDAGRDGGAARRHRREPRRRLTFGVGVAVTAAGGMMFGATNTFNPNSGYDLISRLLAIVILGGLGSIGGALAASVFMLTLESLVDIWSPRMGDRRVLRRPGDGAGDPPDRVLRPAAGAGSVKADT